MSWSNDYNIDVVLGSKNCTLIALNIEVKLDAYEKYKK